MKNNTVLQIRCNDKLKEDFIRVCEKLNVTITESIIQHMKDCIGFEGEIEPTPPQKESKPPKKVEQTNQPKENSKPLERPLSRSELFRGISKNRA